MRVFRGCFRIKHKSGSHLFFFMMLVFFCLSLSAPTLAEQPPPFPTNPSPSTPPPPDMTKDKDQKSLAQKIGEGIYQIGNANINMNIREIKVHGWINMSEGLVEYLAVTPRGKLHESILVLDVEPMHFQVALILLDLNFGRNISYQGDPSTPKGDPVEIYVEWQDQGSLKKYRAEELVFNQATNSPLPSGNWVFTGSVVREGTFMAEREGSLIATYHDPFTIIDNPSPAGADDTILFANQKVLPPPKTPVTVIIKPLAKSKQ